MERRPQLHVSPGENRRNNPVNSCRLAHPDSLQFQVASRDSVLDSQLN